MERPTPSDMMANRDNERDVDLDKKIEALRRKNAALMKRYQEVEEDRKMAEEEGMALQSRKGKADDLTITISKSTSDSRVVVTKPCAVGSPNVKAQQVAVTSRAGDGPTTGSGRGLKKHLTVTMAGKKGKRVVSERAERTAGLAIICDVRCPGEEGQGQHAESAGRGKQTTHTSKRDVRECERCELPSTDLTVPTSPEEQEEYLRWKKEREMIDKERVARHKNAKGQWRRAWDMDKTENMFSDKSLPERERGPCSRGGKNARRGPPWSSTQDSQGPVRVKDKGPKNVPVVSSKAKGKDRLTGRARRWDANEEGEATQTSETMLEEFLEELVALADPEEADHRDVIDSKRRLCPSPEVPTCEEVVSGSVSKALEKSSTVSTPACGEDSAQEKGEVSSPRGTEKRVRFSEELIEGAQTSHSPATEGHADSKSGGASPEKASSPNRTPQDSRGPTLHLESAKEEAFSPLDIHDRSVLVAQQQVPSQTECVKKDVVLPVASDSSPVEESCASLQESSVQSSEHAKCNISNRITEDLIDASLSVLSLESETRSTDTPNTDKARENGKIV